MFRKAINLYKSSFRNIVLIYGGGFVFVEALNLFFEASDFVNMVPYLIISSYVILSIHLKYLSDSSLSKFDPKLASAFLIRYMGLFLFLFVILILFFVIGQLVGSVGLFIGYAIAISLLMFIVAGTVFPAIVLDGDKSISAAIRRGRQNFWLILKPMLIWMLPTFLLVVFVLLLLVFIQSFLEGQFSSVAIGDTTLIELIFAFIGGVLGYFLSAVGVVILCDAYKAIKAKEAAAESA